MEKVTFEFYLFVIIGGIDYTHVAATSLNEVIYVSLLVGPYGERLVYNADAYGLEDWAEKHGL